MLRRLDMLDRYNWIVDESGSCDVVFLFFLFLFQMACILDRKTPHTDSHSRATLSALILRKTMENEGSFDGKL